MKKTSLFLVSMLIAMFSMAQEGGFCDIQNFSFKPGEKLTYKVFYNVSMMYIGAGEVNFGINLEKWNGKTVYHVLGDGRTYGSYDWFFKVRDRYETFIDTATMLPVHFIRVVNEGDYHKENQVTFDQVANTAATKNGSYKVPACVQDVMSAIYYARNIDFNKYQKGDKIPFSMFLDNEVYHIYIRYLGKEEVETRFGKFRAIKFKPLLIKGTIFEGGEKMTVWVSDDMNRIPLRVNSPISVGSIKVDMIGYKNLRYPLSALIRKR